jgi:hypothetical protein
MLKYKNLTELAAAFKTGELKKNLYMLQLDNDCSSLRYIGPIASEEDLDEKNDECDDWFRGNGYADLKEACEIAGIPCEWC